LYIKGYSSNGYRVQLSDQEVEVGPAEWMSFPGPWHLISMISSRDELLRFETGPSASTADSMTRRSASRYTQSNQRVLLCSSKTDTASRVEGVTGEQTSIWTETLADPSDLLNIATRLGKSSEYQLVLFAPCSASPFCASRSWRMGTMRPANALRVTCKNLTERSQRFIHGNSLEHQAHRVCFQPSKGGSSIRCSSPSHDSRITVSNRIGLVSSCTAREATFSFASDACRRSPARHSAMTPRTSSGRR
jgi:hypothetical protein